MRKKNLYVLQFFTLTLLSRNCGFCSYFNKISLSLQRIPSENETPFLEGRVACIFEEENVREKAKLFGYFSACN